MFFSKKKKMSKIEKKEFNKIKTAKKDAKAIKKKISTTLGWIDIDEIADDYIKLEKNKKVEYIKGIKLYPHNIFIDNPEEQSRRLNKIRICLNKPLGSLYFNFVYSPVVVDEQIANLMLQEEIEDDLHIRNMLSSDLSKIEMFQENFKELEFFVMIKDKDLKSIEKRFLDLEYEFKNAGFEPRKLNKKDFYNYMRYVFENPLINDFYYSRGIFSYLNQDMIFNEETQTYEKIDTTENFERFEEEFTAIPNIKPDSKKIKKSKLAPTSFKLTSDKYILGDKYCCNLLVTELPKVFWLGILCDYLNDPEVKVFMTTNRLDMDIASLLKKDYNEKESNLIKTKDPYLRQRLSTDLESLRNYIADVQSNNDITHNITLVFSIYCDNNQELETKKKELRVRLSNAGFKVINATFMQEMLLRRVCPIFIDNKLPNTIAENVGIPLPSDAVAGLYPFVFETMKDKKGFLLGYELQNGGIILLDMFYYLNEPKERAFNNRLNGNFIVVGQSGSGKTTLMNLIIRDFIKNKVKLIWIDPENKNEYLTKRYKGTFVPWGQRGAIINIFDLKPNSTEDDDPEWLEKMYDTELSIFNVIEDVNQILQFLFTSIDENILSLVGELVIKSYEKVGIKKDKDGNYKSFKGLDYKDMPTFETFYECLQERILELKGQSEMKEELALLNQLNIKMKRIMNEWSIYFVGHTTIKPNASGREIISFGTKILYNVSSNLRDALYHIMFKFSWALCLNNEERAAFVIDEGHTMILEGSTAKLVSQFYRRARKYETIMGSGTQEPRDYADPRVLTEGKAMFNSSSYKIVMSLKKDAVEDLKKLENINSNEGDLILDFKQGEALMIAGDRRIPIKVLATESELQEMGQR